MSCASFRPVKSLAVWLSAALVLSSSDGACEVLARQSLRAPGQATLVLRVPLGSSGFSLDFKGPQLKGLAASTALAARAPVTSPTPNSPPALAAWAVSAAAVDFKPAAAALTPAVTLREGLIAAPNGAADFGQAGLSARFIRAKERISALTQAEPLKALSRGVVSGGILSRLFDNRVKDPSDAVPIPAGKDLSDLAATLNLSLRPARVSDKDALHSFLQRIRTEYGVDTSGFTMDGDGWDADLADLDRFYGQGGGKFLVLENARGEIVGTGGVTPTDPGVLQLRKLYLAPEVRGKGLAKAMTAYFIAQARAMGFSGIELDTHPNMKEAISLYKKFGFGQFAAHWQVPGWPTYYLSLKRSLPKSYRLYLLGQGLSYVGLAISLILLPTVAYQMAGSGFAVIVQAVGLLGMIAGSFAGAWWVPRFGSKSAYILAYSAFGVGFLSLWGSLLLTGGILPLYYLIFSALSQVVFGALRGVAEQDMNVQTLGQGNKELLKTAATMYYLVVSPVHIAASLLTGSLDLVQYLPWFLLGGSLTLFLSTIPFFLIRLSSGRSGLAPTAGAAQTKESLAKDLYLPFIFFWAMHLALFQLFGPFFALSLFGGKIWIAWITSSYAAGSTLMALAKAWLPEPWMKRLSEKQWSVFGIVAALAFLWGSLAFASPWVSTGLAFFFGMGSVMGQAQWKGLYSDHLRKDKQPSLFRWLNVLGVLVNLALFAFLYGAPRVWPSASMPSLLTWVAVAVTVAAAALALALRRLKLPQDRPATNT